MSSFNFRKKWQDIKDLTVQRSRPEGPHRVHSNSSSMSRTFDSGIAVQGEPISRRSRKNSSATSTGSVSKSPTTARFLPTSPTSATFLNPREVPSFFRHEKDNLSSTRNPGAPSRPSLLSPTTQELGHDSLMSIPPIDISNVHPAHRPDLRRSRAESPVKPKFPIKTTSPFPPRTSSYLPPETPSPPPVPPKSTARLSAQLSAAGFVMRKRVPGRVSNRLPSTHEAYLLQPTTYIPGQVFHDREFSTDETYPLQQNAYILESQPGPSHAYKYSIAPSGLFATRRKSFVRQTVLRHPSPGPPEHQFITSIPDADASLEDIVAWVMEPGPEDTLVSGTPEFGIASPLPSPRSDSSLLHMLSYFTQPIDDSRDYRTERYEYLIHRRAEIAAETIKMIEADEGGSEDCIESANGWKLVADEMRTLERFWGYKRD